MTGSGEKDWRRSLGTDAAKSESERLSARSKESAEAAASSMAHQQAQMRFTAKVNKFIETLRNKTIYDLEEVNRNATPAPRGGVIPTAPNGFEIWRQFPYDRLPEAFGEPQTPPKYVTAAMIPPGTSTLIIRHPEDSGKKNEEFTLEENADDESLVVRNGDEVVPLDVLIQRILTPIFQIRKAAR